MLEKTIERFKEAYTFKEVEEGEFKSFKISGMNFDVEGYDVEGLGHASLMKATGMLGAMKMESFIVDPFDVDAPLLSIDRIQAMGNDTLYMEIYDTCLDPERKEEGFENVKKKYAELNDVPLKENWYDHLRYGSSIIKKVKKGQSDALDACIEEYAEAYLELLKKAAPCDHDRKKEKAREYSDGLIENGGPATDAFLKSWGKEKTAEYFAKVLFG